MNLYSKLAQLQEQGLPIRLGLIGAGKFAAMYLAQVPKTPGIHMVAIADLSPDNAKNNLKRVGWDDERFGACSLDEALSKGQTYVTDDWEELTKNPKIDIIIEATGSPMEAVSHVLAAIENGKHIVHCER